MKFKTNINCGGCIEKVSPFLNKIENLEWEVDTQNPDKVLTAEGASEEQITEAVKQAGFSIEKI